MGAVLRDSTLYTGRDVNAEIQDARDLGGRVVPIYFTVTVVAAATDGDSYNLCVLPANWSVITLHASTDGLGASAGAGVLAEIGTVADPNLLMAQTDFDVADAVGNINFLGIAHRPTVNTIIQAVFSGAAPVVGQIFSGHLLCVPGA